MKCNKGDYVVVDFQIAPRKSIIMLARVTKVIGKKEKTRLIVTLCWQQASTEMEDQEVDIDDVLANLGRSPSPYMGPVFNTKILYRQEKNVKTSMGIMEFYRPLPKEHRKLMLNVVETAYEQMEELGFHELCPIDIQIHPKTSPTVDGYFQKRKGLNDLIVLCPEDQIYDVRGALLYILYHEYGHCIQHNLFTQDQSSYWVRRFHDYIQLHDITDEMLNMLWTNFEGEGRFTHTDDPTQIKEIAKIFYRWIKDKHKLDKKHLESVWATGHAKPLKERIWPNSPLDLSQYARPMVTEYSKKEPYEFWCENFAIWMLLRTFGKTKDEFLDLDKHQGMMLLGVGSDTSIAIEVKDLRDDCVEQTVQELQEK